MGWRIKITVDSTSQADSVHGLGNMALVADLEVRLGITIACLPTLTPLFAKYLKPVISDLTDIPKKDAFQNR